MELEFLRRPQVAFVGPCDNHGKPQVLKDKENSIMGSQKKNTRSVSLPSRYLLRKLVTATRTKKIIITSFVILFFSFAVFYLLIVLIHASGRGNFYLYPKKNCELPTIPEECRQNLELKSLNPYANVHPIEFREYDNVWLWRSGKTLMYDAKILNNKDCRDYFIQLLLVTQPSIILVFYDREIKSEVLIMKNYK